METQEVASVYDRETGSAYRIRLALIEGDLVLSDLLSIRKAYNVCLDNIVRGRSKLNPVLLGFSNVYKKLINDSVLAFVGQQFESQEMGVSFAFETRNEKDILIAMNHGEEVYISFLEDINAFLEFQNEKMNKLLETLSFNMDKKSFVLARKRFDLLLKGLHDFLKEGVFETFEEFVNVYWDLIFRFTKDVVISAWPDDARFQAYVVGDQVAALDYLRDREEQLVGKDNLRCMDHSIAKSLVRGALDKIEEEIEQMIDPDDNWASVIAPIRLKMLVDLDDFVSGSIDGREVNKDLIVHIASMVRMTSILSQISPLVAREMIESQILAGFNFQTLSVFSFLNDLGILEFLARMRAKVISLVQRYPELETLDGFSFGIFSTDFLDRRSSRKLAWDSLCERDDLPRLIVDTSVASCSDLKDDELDDFYFIFSFLMQIDRMDLLEDIVNISNGCTALYLETVEEVVFLLDKNYPNNVFASQIESFRLYLARRIAKYGLQ